MSANSLTVTAHTSTSHPAKPIPRPRIRMRRVRAFAQEAPISAVLVTTAIAMLPWLVSMPRWVPSTAVAHHWSIAWIGLDAMEAVGMASTGLLLYRGDQRHQLSAASTATLLVLDAWFDITTSAPGTEVHMALAMAAFAELPMAALCLWIATPKRSLNGGG